jgi:hypothetical protein
MPAPRFFPNYIEMQHGANTLWSVLPIGHTIVAALKALHYLNERHKVRIVELLSMWLLDDSGTGSMLKVAAIQRMADEVSKNWWRQHAGLGFTE